MGNYKGQLNTKTPATILVSPKDRHLVENQVWTASYDKKWNISYARATINGKSAYLHRVVMNAKRGEIVDHINGNGLDNRRENLRIVSHRENALNSKARKGASKFKGVYFNSQRRNQKKPWYVQVRSAELGKKHIGTFATELEAARAYNKAALQYYGEFARLNEC